MRGGTSMGKALIQQHQQQKTTAESKCVTNKVWRWLSEQLVVPATITALSLAQICFYLIFCASKHSACQHSFVLFAFVMLCVCLCVRHSTEMYAVCSTDAAIAFRKSLWREFIMCFVRRLLLSVLSSEFPLSRNNLWHLQLQFLCLFLFRNCFSLFAPPMLFSLYN